jgi:hypothetical protein
MADTVTPPEAMIPELFRQAAAGERELPAVPPPSPLPDEVTRRKQLENDALAQDIRLKEQTLQRLFVFLTIETVVIFAMAFMQAIHWPFGFNLDDWSFRLLLAATISQITFMLNIAVKNLFPRRAERKD